MPLSSTNSTLLAFLLTFFLVGCPLKNGNILTEMVLVPFFTFFFVVYQNSKGSFYGQNQTVIRSLFLALWECVSMECVKYSGWQAGGLREWLKVTKISLFCWIDAMGARYHHRVDCAIRCCSSDCRSGFQSRRERASLSTFIFEWTVENGFCWDFSVNTSFIYQI